MKTIVHLLTGIFCCLNTLAADEKASPPPEQKPPALEEKLPKSTVRPSPDAVRPERPAAGNTTGSLVSHFSQARQAYLAKSSELQKALQVSNEQQRQALRDQLKSLREEQSQAREQLRRQLQVLRERLPSHRDLIENAREREGHPRRGGE